MSKIAAPYNLEMLVDNVIGKVFTTNVLGTVQSYFIIQSGESRFHLYYHIVDAPSHSCLGSSLKSVFECLSKSDLLTCELNGKKMFRVKDTPLFRGTKLLRDGVNYLIIWSHDKEKYQLLNTDNNWVFDKYPEFNTLEELNEISYRFTRKYFTVVE